jgi:predicted aspartyl protease
MSTRFQARHGLIVVQAQVWGPEDHAIARLALDTGAAITVIHPDVLRVVGYDIAMATERVRMATASGITYAPRLVLDKLGVLGRVREAFSVSAHALPAEIAIDGLLGLDYLRDQRLTLDFRSGEIALD